MSHLPPGADPIVWTRVINLLTTIDQAQPDSPAREAFRKFALTVLAPVGLRVGSAAKAGEDPAITATRSRIWSARARFGDANALERARALHASHKGSPDERRTALAIIAHSADQATFASLLSQARSTTDPQERSHLLDALASVAIPRLPRNLSTRPSAATLPPALRLNSSTRPLWRIQTPSGTLFHSTSTTPTCPSTSRCARRSFPRLRQCPRSRIALLTCSNMPTNTCQLTLGRR
jgi:hypothetical protein